MSQAEKGVLFWDTVGEVLAAAWENSKTSWKKASASTIPPALPTCAPK